MSISLALKISESNIDAFANTSTVTVSLTLTHSGKKSGSGSGYLTIDGTKYTYNTKSIPKDGTITLITKSKSITHTADGSKTISIQGRCEGYIITSTGESFGVSDFTRTKSQNYTCSKITRKFNIVLNDQQGHTNTYTKIYNNSLSLYTPTRTGYDFKGWCTGTGGTGTNYKNTYTANAATTLYAYWTEKTYAVTLYANGGSVSSTSYTKRYFSNLSLPTPTRTGYTFKGWYSGTTNYGNTYYTNAAATLTASWSAISYKVSFDANGGSESVPSQQTAIYDSAFNVPQKPANLEKLGYIFKGWTRDKSSYSVQYAAGSSVKWTIASDTILYAAWEPIFITVNFYKNKGSTISGEYEIATSDTKTAIKYQSYTLPNIAPPTLANYTFSGYWTLSQPNTKIYTEYGISFPAGVIPYDYVITSSDGFYTRGHEFTNVTQTINLYPVYRDNTRTTISLVSSKYNYIPDSTTEVQYYSYISNKSKSINISTVNNNVIAGFVFKTDSGAKDVDLKTISISLKSSPGGSTVNLNPIYINKEKNDNLNISYIYVVCRTTGDADHQGVLIDPENINYVFSLTNLTDSFGKTIQSISKLVEPPKIIRDINADGDVVSFFGSAPDYSSSEKLNHPDNELIVNGIIKSKIKKFDYTKFTYITNRTRQYSTDSGGSSTPEAIKVNGIVNLKGAIYTTSVINAAGDPDRTNNTQQIGVVPKGCEPYSEQHILCQGSGQNRFLLWITSDGKMHATRYGYGSSSPENIPSGSWLNISCTYISKD